MAQMDGGDGAPEAESGGSRSSRSVWSTQKNPVLSRQADRQTDVCINRQACVFLLFIYVLLLFLGVSCVCGGVCH